MICASGDLKVVNFGFGFRFTVDDSTSIRCESNGGGRIMGRPENGAIQKEKNLH
jgi:hypothetical protein